MANTHLGYRLLDATHKIVYIVLYYLKKYIFLKLSKDTPPKNLIFKWFIAHVLKACGLIWITNLPVGINWVGVAGLQTEIWTQNGRNNEHKFCLLDRWDWRKGVGENQTDEARPKTFKHST